MLRTAVLMVRRVATLALFLCLGVLLFADAHLRTGGISTDFGVFTNQRFHRGDPATNLSTHVFISCNVGTIFNADNLNVRIPADANLEFDPTQIPNLSGPMVPSKVNNPLAAANFTDVGTEHTLFIDALADFVPGDNFQINSIRLRNFLGTRAPFHITMDTGIGGIKTDDAWWMIAEDPTASLPGGQATVFAGTATNPLGDLTIRESNVSPIGGAPFNGAIWTNTDIRITIPAGLGVTWDQTAVVTNNLPGKVSTASVDYSENGGRTARIDVTGDFAQNEAVTLSGLRLNVSASSTDQAFDLSIRCGGAANTTAHSTVSGACFIRGLPKFTASTGTSLFWVGDPPSGAQSFTVQESAGTPKIKAAGDLALNIPAGFDMTWDPAGPAPTASISAGAGTVAAACIIENGNKTLRVDVTADLVSSQSITISGARFANFTAREAANGFVELEIGATGISGPEAVDTRGIRISQPTISSANDHIFLVNQGAATTINAITLTEDATNNRIINGTQIRLRMNGVNVVFSGTNPTLGGNLAGAAVVFEDPAGGGNFSTMRLTSSVAWTTGSTGTISNIPVVANSPADVGNFQIFMSSSASATATSTDTSLLVLGDLPTLSSGTPQAFTVNDGSTVANTITIGASIDASPLFQDPNSLEIVIPGTLNLEWANVQPTLIGGSASGKVAASVTFPNTKTLRLLITSAWSGAETLTLQGLQFTNFQAVSSGSGTSLQLRVRVGGPFAATDSQPKSIGLPTMVSNANQVFGEDDSPTPMSPIVITEDPNTPRIRTTTDIRIRIPALFNMTWNSAPIAVPGAGTGTVGTPVLDTASILRIPVTANFSAGQTLTISGGTFAFNSSTSGLDNLELLVNGTTNATPNGFDTRTIKVGTRPSVQTVTTGDANGGIANGSIDRLIVKFSETLFASSLSATTGLGFSVAGYNISAAGVSGDTLTLFLAETGQADTSATPALTYDPAAGDLADTNDTLELTATPPATQDGSSPIIVSLSKLDSNGNGFLDQVSFTFSEAIGGTPDITRWILVDANGTTNLLQGLTSGAFSISGNVLTITLSDSVGTTGTPRFQYLSGGGNILTDLAATPNAVPTLTNNTLPVANAGADLTVMPSVVLLDGTASFDPDGAQPLTYSWSLDPAPAPPASVTITNPGSSVASVILRAAGSYTFRLRVTDLIGFREDTAVITVLNVPPVSDPVLVRSTVTVPTTNTFLRGVLSTDVNNDISFTVPPANNPLWAIVSQPAGSAVTLVNPNAEFFAGFNGPGLTIPGVYELSFTVKDLAANASLPTSVFITATSAGTPVPFANAGPDVVVPVGTPTTLDAGLSWSPSAPTFTWTRPDATTATGQTLTFTPPGAGLFTFKLTVTAAGVVSAPDTVTIMAYNSSNRPPVALASKLSPAGVPVIGDTIQLDSTGSLDPENAALSYAWSQVSGPTASLSNPAAAQPTFAPAVQGVYEFQLVVFDGTQLSFPSTVIVQVVPSVGVTAVSVSGTPSGTAASAGHFLSGNPVTLTSSLGGSVVNTWWEQMAGPTVLLTHDLTINPATFTPTAAGNYTFRVTALDFGNNLRVSSLTHVQIDTAVNQSPNANAGSNQIGIAAGTLVTLDGAASADDTAVTNYFWTQVAGPPVTLSNPHAVSPSFTPTTGATYVFQLTVTDGAASSAPSFVSVTVNPAPTPGPVGGGGGGGGGCGLTFEPLLILALVALYRRGRRS
jgi:hypothetical protein